MVPVPGYVQGLAQVDAAELGRVGGVEPGAQERIGDPFFEQIDGQEIEEIAAVDGGVHAVDQVHRRASAAGLGAVLDIVHDERAVVDDLRQGGQGQGEVAGAEDAGRRAPGAGAAIACRRGPGVRGRAP